MARLEDLPETLDLSLWEGDDLNLGITFDFDLTGYHSFRGHVKRKPGANEPIVAEWVFDAVDPEPNRRIIGHLQSRMELNGCGYDLEVLDVHDQAHTFLTGQIDITPQYTG